jgi:hypothetical protein
MEKKVKEQLLGFVCSVVFLLLIIAGGCIRYYYITHETTPKDEHTLTFEMHRPVTPSMIIQSTTLNGVTVSDTTYMYTFYR